MTNSERYQKYIKEHRKNCKNRTSNLCDIRIAVKNDVIETKCVYYEKENNLEGYKEQTKVMAKKQKPIMKGINK